MSNLKEYYQNLEQFKVFRVIMSKPEKNCEFKKIVVEEKKDFYQVSKYTQKQVFHENVKKEFIREKCISLTEGYFRQVNAFDTEFEHILLVSKKGECTYKKVKIQEQRHIGKKNAGECQATTENICGNGENLPMSHNRKKKYLLDEGKSVKPLIDMGIFTKEGKIVNSMYDKYRQINRFLEMIDDEISDAKLTKLNVIDFGCGKSYLTFVVYYYLTEIRHLDVSMVGLDLKADVIEKCNAASKKYGYEKLKFELGDIGDYQAPFSVDMVITLHACDTATDYALYHAICWKANYIFSVPCCQHELNAQMQPKNLSILSRYGIVKERFCALATDAIRGNLLESAGYKTQLLEFVDFEHTPKNVLIRAVRRSMMPKGTAEKAVDEACKLMEEFGFSPKLWELLRKK